MALDNFSLKCFLSVASTKNITKSADIVGRTQSAVSQQITRLETLLGKALFDRNKEMRLTEAGELFVLYAKKISALQQEAVMHIQNDITYKTIRFGFSDDLASLMMPHVFTTFSAAYPNAILNMVSGQSNDIFNQFLEKNLDICLIKEYTTKPTMKPERCFKDELVWIGQANMTMQKTNTVPLILSPPTSTLNGLVMNLLDKYDIKYRIVLSSNSFISKLSAVENGLGIMIIPQSHISTNPKVDILSHLPRLGDVLFSLYCTDKGPIEADLIQIIDTILSAQNIHIK